MALPSTLDITESPPPGPWPVASGGAPSVPTEPTPAGDPVAALSVRVEGRLRSLLEGERATWIAHQPTLAALFDALDQVVAHPRPRLRPAFCYWGAVAAGAGTDDEPAGLLDTCAALELLHAFALIHDEVIDGGGHRHDRPTLPVHFARHHERSVWAGDSGRHGDELALLAGDTAFVLADALLDDTSPEVRRVWHDLRMELVAGQWVDAVAGASVDRSPALARWVARYRTGRYTVERPLHLGAALAGAPGLADAYSAFGGPLGVALHLRDDLLGVFGDEGDTGRPAGDDLRSGRPTLLLSVATVLAKPGDRRLLARVGSPDLTDDEIAALRRSFARSGARALVEDEISRLTRSAVDSLLDCDIDAGARHQLLQLARQVAPTGP